MDVITSPQNPRVKRLLRLQQKTADRRAEGLTVVEGLRELTIAARAGVEIAELYHCPTLPNAAPTALLAGLGVPAAHIWQLAPAAFERIAYRDGSDGVVALVYLPALALSDLRLPPNPLLLVAEAVEKPGNLGALLRTADAAAVDAVLVLDPRTDVWSPNVIRASIGCAFTRPLIACGREEGLSWLAARGIRTFAAALTPSARPYTVADFRGPTALMLGTEADGLTSATLARADETIIIPMRGLIDSLNVSVAAAVLTFEAVRQRQTNRP
ncbi:MAG: RNA methyltransferase [Hymenobacteraceae bacterium]|nr:RNA methyltransferase [Hymenobacteraceae bacterium]